MNIFMETLSLINGLPDKPDSYRVNSNDMIPAGSNEAVFLGKQTNEAPSKYIIWSMVQRGQMLDKIFVLVTEQCLKDEIACINGKTTYRYYVEMLENYLNELMVSNAFIRQYISENHHGLVSEYINHIVSAIVVPEGVTGTDWKDIVSAILELDQNNAYVQKNIYMDITGGSRLAGLISLLLLKVIESFNASVKQIIYSDITIKSDRKIVDCTPSYQLLNNIENIARANLSDGERTQKIMKEMHNMGLVSEQDIEDTKEIDRELERSQKELIRDKEYKKKEQSFEKKVTGSSAVAKMVKRNAVDTLKSNNRKSAFKKLLNRKVDELIMDFHSEILFIMIDLNIVLTSFNGSGFDKKNENLKKNLENELKAHEDYYCWIKNKNSKGVLPFTADMVSYLLKILWKDPVKNFEHCLNPNNNRYTGFINRYRFVKGISKAENDRFMEYLDNSGIDYRKLPFEKVLEIQRVCYNYSFPFFCVSQCDRYPQIEEYYRNEVHLLMERLKNIKQNEGQDAYKKKLESLLDGTENNDYSELEKELPFMVQSDSWSINVEKFDSKEAADKFLKELLGRIEKVRPYRNAVAHRLKNTYSIRENQDKIVNEIKGWLDEYDEMF